MIVEPHRPFERDEPVEVLENDGVTVAYRGTVTLGEREGWLTIRCDDGLLFCVSAHDCRRVGEAAA